MGWVVALVAVVVAVVVLLATGPPYLHQAQRRQFSEQDDISENKKQFQFKHFGSLHMWSSQLYSACPDQAGLQ